MGSLFSKTETFPETYDLTYSDEMKSKLSCNVSDFMSTVMSKPPLKLKLIDMYHSLYERVFGPWGRVVGSYADCMSVLSSDVDFILEGFEVYSSPFDIPCDGYRRLVICTDDPDIPPGCCWLRAYRKCVFTRMASPENIDTYPRYVKCVLTKRITKREWKMVNMKGLKLLSSKNFYEEKQQGGLTAFPFLNYFLPTWSSHGPAFRQKYFKIFDVDILAGFSCKKVPSALQRWSWRNRKEWPTPETIEKALKQGCHVIGLPSKITSGQYEEVEFRFGFGDMEKVLIHSLNDTQKHCYLLLKIILKEYIEPHFPDEDIISSYVMKTLILWMAEETNPNIWEKKNLMDCLQMCLEQLYKWLNSANCPNYFIPEYNLFRTKDRQMLDNIRIWFGCPFNNTWRILIKCDSTKHLFAGVN